MSDTESTHPDQVGNDQTAPVLGIMQSQLEKDLTRIIEQHNSQIEAEKERMEREKQELMQRYESEIEQLKLAHEKQIEDEKLIQQRKMKILQEALNLESQALLARNQKEIIRQRDEMEHQLAEAQKLIQSEDLEEEIQVILKKLEDLGKAMSTMPRTSSNPEDYQKLMRINKVEMRLIKTATMLMRQQAKNSLINFSKNLAESNNNYHQLFTEYQRSAAFARKADNGFLE